MKLLLSLLAAAALLLAGCTSQGSEGKFQTWPVTSCCQEWCNSLMNEMYQSTHPEVWECWEGIDRDFPCDGCRLIVNNTEYKRNTTHRVVEVD
jgi:hypothetical protein